MFANPPLLSDFLRSAIAARGITAAETARRVGISKAYLSNILRDRKHPSTSVCLALSQELGVSFDAFAQYSVGSETSQLTELNRIASNLPPEDIEELLLLARHKLNRIPRRTNE